MIKIVAYENDNIGNFSVTKIKMELLTRRLF